MKDSTFENAKKKMYRYCAYQERCHREVKNKLVELGLGATQADELLAHLITEGFINEERFAKAFAGGKFRLKKWGRLKIVHELEARGLTSNCIRAGLKEIDDAEYRQTLARLTNKRIKDTTAENKFKLRDKVAKSLITKGYEPDLVWREIKTQMSG